MSTDALAFPAPETLATPQFIADVTEPQVHEATPETAVATTAIDPTTELSSVDDALLDFHNMGDVELIEVVRDVARKYTTFREYFRVYAPAIQRLHKTYAKKGQRLPIEGKPTWDDFVTDNFGVSARYLLKLLNPPKTAEKNPPAPLDLGDFEALFERMTKKPFLASMDQVLGELEPQEFAAALEGFARLIAEHYSQQVEITIAAPSDGEADGDTDPDYESGGEQESARA